MASKFIEKTRRKTIKQVFKFVEFNIFRLTGRTYYWRFRQEPARHHTTTAPDTVVLTPAEDPATMQTVNWRTGPAVTAGVVEYRLADIVESVAETVTARYKVLDMPEISDDPISHHFTATMTGLEPATRYAYRVGVPSEGPWSLWYEFTTGPAKAQPFTFAFLGDVQEGFKSVEGAFQRIEKDYPQTAFYLMAGDFVDIGSIRNGWDIFFAHSAGVFTRKFLAPTPGNHDYHHIDPKGPVGYVSYFELPANGPAGLPPNLAYAFAYGDAYFVVADTNQSLSKQTRWLRKRLRHGRDHYRWLMVLMHNPVYSAKGRTNKKLLRTKWATLFDKYGVDIVFGGHDHSYMRSHKLCDGQPVKHDAPGTFYVVATAGSRFYSYKENSLAAVQKPRGCIRLG